MNNLLGIWVRQLADDDVNAGETAVDDDDVNRR